MRLCARNGANVRKFFKYNKFFKQSVICVVLLTFVLNVSKPFMSYAVTQDDLDDANEHLNQLREEMSGLSDELSSLNSQLDSASSRLNDIESKIKNTEDKITQVSKQIEEYNVQKDKQYDAMKLRIKYMYENSSENAFNMIFDSSDMSQLLRNIEYITQISAYDHDKMQELSELIVKSNEAQNTLSTELASLNELKAQAVAQADDIKQLINDKKSEIDASSDAIQTAEQIALAYEKSIQEQMINNQISDKENINDNNAGYDGSYDYDDNDLAMLAAIIECEAGNQPYEGMVAVGNVVMNRVSSPRFPNTITAVLYSKNQFSPVASGRFAIVLARGAKSTCVQAAQDALNGKTVTNALFFHQYRPSIDVSGTIIGDHIFF